nr:hypothetical protein [uncultured Rhodopila sp.]
MRTLVIQTYRTSEVAPWMQRCLDSVRSWSALQGYEYEFMDDRIFDLCGAEYLAGVGDNKRSITNLARLELARTRLAQGWERVVWLDADTFVFAPDRLTIDVTKGYAFAKEAWVWIDPQGRTMTEQGVHNAAFVFAGHHPDLDLLIHAIRHIVSTRRIHASYQVGTKLLVGLQYSLDFPVLTNIGMFSPDVMSAIALGQAPVLAALARASGYPSFAANLCLSLNGGMTREMIRTAMDRLETSRGQVVNQYLGGGGSDSVAATVMPARGLVSQSFQLDSPLWLLTRSARLLAVKLLPASVARMLRMAQAHLTREVISPQ